MKQNRSVEHDCIDSSELLEELEDHGYDKLWTIAAFQNVAERMFHGGSFVTGNQNVVELFFYVFNASNFAKNLAGSFMLATLHERVGSVGQKDSSEGDKDGRQAGDSEGDTPSIAGHLFRAVVHEICEEDADGHRQLEKDIKRPSPL